MHSTATKKSEYADWVEGTVKLSACVTECREKILTLPELLSSSQCYPAIYIGLNCEIHI
jgi:hypothetical protein